MSLQLLGGQWRVAAELLGSRRRLTKPQASASAVLRGASWQSREGTAGRILPGDQQLPHRTLMMKLDPNIRYIGVRSGPAGYGGDLLSRLN